MLANEETQGESEGACTTRATPDHLGGRLGQRFLTRPLPNPSSHWWPGAQQGMAGAVPGLGAGPKAFASSLGRKALAAVGGARPSTPPSIPRVAVLGAGISGLVCAMEVAAGGGEVALFEQSRGPGGRVSSRVVQGGAENGFVWDHGCQYFCPKSPEAVAAAQQWLEAGAVAEWNGRFGSVDVESGRWKEEESGHQRLVGSPQMSSLAEHLLERACELGVSVHLGSKVDGLKWLDEEGAWSVASTHREQGVSETLADVVVASDCLLAPVIDDVESAQGLAAAMRSFGTTESASSSFAAMLAVRGPTGLPDGIMVRSSETVAWMAKDSSKPGRSGCVPEDVELWTVHASPGYAAKVMEERGLTRRGSLEHNALLEEVGQALLQGAKEAVASASEALGAPEGFPDLVHEPRCHRWAAGFPSTEGRGDSDGPRFKASSCGTVLACGDWAAPSKERGRVEAAILSGKAAARAALA